eukprot:765260-Hanusia_phi.AAC.2
MPIRVATGKAQKDTGNANDDDASRQSATSQGDEQPVGSKRATRNTNQKTIGDFFPTKKNRTRAPVKSLKDQPVDSKQRSSDELESGDEPKIDFSQPPEELPTGPKVKEIRGASHVQEVPDDMNQAVALLQSLSNTVGMDMAVDDMANAENGNENVAGSPDKRTAASKEVKEDLTITGCDSD